VDAVSPSERAGVIVHPLRVDDIAALRDEVDKVLAGAGMRPAAYRETTPQDPGGGVAAELLAEGCSPLLVAGGDGTVREVCTAAAGTGTPVVVLPLGTGNLLVRNLDLPLEMDAALAAAVSGVDRRIDLGRVGGDGLSDQGFVVMAGMGFDAAIMADAPERLKARFGPVAYVVSGIRHLRDEAFRVQVTVDGRTSRHRARTVLVGNVGSLQAGVELLPDANPDDGVLDVVVVAPRRPLDWPVLAWRILRRDRRRDRRLHRMSGTQISVRADRPVQRQLDGDPQDAGRELTVSTDPGAVVIRGGER
jgi:YegS/Rv2252/BmrU family lipid kinase